MKIQVQDTTFYIDPNMEYQGDIQDTEALSAFNHMKFIHQSMHDEFTSDKQNLILFTTLLITDSSTAFAAYNEAKGRQV